MEWFTNIGLWINDNWPAIVGTSSSVSLVGIISTIIAVFKQGKSVKENTKSTNDLNDSVQANQKLQTTVDNNTTSVKELKQSVDSYKEENEQLKEAFEKTNKMLETILEVMGIVYSTLKDETIRTTVSNIITNAKYTETATRLELIKQIEELKEKVAEDAEKLKEKVAEDAEKIKTVVTPTVNTNTRY